MDIFSKRDGPRPEDVRARKLISGNAGTIRRLADQISNGGFTRMRAEEARRKQEPQPEGLLIYTMSARRIGDAPDPHVRLSLNGRVVLSDRGTGRQLQVLGEIRGRAGAKRFVLASAENGYISPVSDEIHAALAPFEDIEIGPDFTEEDIVLAFSERLGLAEAQQVDCGGSDAQSQSGEGMPDHGPSELL